MILLLSALLGASTLYYVSLCVYRLTLHPLAKYPGPRLNAVTAWPQAISAIRGRAHLDTHLLHEKYGDIVRIAPEVLVFRSERAVHDIYDRKANVIKTGWTDVSLAINPTISTQSMNDRSAHAKRRRLLANAFSESALRNLEYHIIDRVQAFCGILAQFKSGTDGKSEKANWGQSRDMSTWANNLTLDVLGELCFGKTFGALEAGGHMAGELLLSASSINQVFAFMPIRHLFYPFLRSDWLMNKTKSKAVKQKLEFRQAILPLLKNRFALEAESKKKGVEPRHDFMHYLINATDPESGEKFTPKDLVGEATLLVAAGSDTTAVCIAATYFYLTRNLEALGKVQAEVRAAFDSVDDIKNGVKLSSLPYLRACIDEGLRMSPPVPGVLHRKVLPGGISIDGRHIPAGTAVGSSAYAVHHSEAHFPRPFEYIPERWIAGSEGLGFPVTQSSIEYQKQAFIPFSTGPRNCVGKNMAIMELLITMGRLMWLFDVRKEAGDLTGAGKLGLEEGREREEEFQLQDYFICGRKGPILEFKKREGVEL